MSPTILYEKDGPIATITINRPGARNALTPEMLCRLADAFVDFRNDRQLRVAILTGTGELAFCAGGDLARTLPLLTGAREAEDQGKPMADHVTHLLVHGVLHLLVYDHVEDEDATLMEALEVRILASLGVSDPY